MKIERYLPAVGENCEIIHDRRNEWWQVKVKAITDEYLIVRHIDSNAEQHYYLKYMSFRPLKSPKELAVEAIRNEMKHVRDFASYGDIYDVIASGKIPGVMVGERSK